MGRSSRGGGGGSSGRSSSSGGSRGFSGGMNSAGRSSRSSVSKSTPSSPPRSNPSTIRSSSFGSSSFGGSSFGSNNSNYRKSSNSPTYRKSYDYDDYDYRPSSSNYGSSSYDYSSSQPGILAVIFMFAIILFIGVAISQAGSHGLKNLTPREPLSISSSIETKYYTDELGWIKKPGTLEKGMKEFYKKTGVQPHLYITDNIYGEANPDNKLAEKFMNEKYDELFKDEAHLLLVFLDNGEDWGQWIMTGSMAKSVIDSEAQDFIHSIVEKYTMSDLEDEEMFSTVFNESAKLLMNVYKSPWPKILLIMVSLGATAIVIVVVTKSRVRERELEVEQDKLNQEILNTPLEEIKSATEDVDNLFDKYK